MKQIIVFAGTTEGRELSQALGQAGVQVLACTATEYGSQLMEQEAGLSVHAGRLTGEEMCGLFEAERPRLVVDATHPYASVVSENIRNACENTGTEYLRLIRRREQVEEADCIQVENTAQAVEYLKTTTGNVLLTTGSKELAAFTAIPDYAQRLYARVLSTPEVAESCSRLGFVGRHLICMQGPFSKELNVAMLRQCQARYLVTKESGKAGGFPEKLEAVREAGAQMILIGRPPEQPGKTPEEVWELLRERFHLSSDFALSERAHGGGEAITREAAVAGTACAARRVTLAGIGMGTPETMTREVWEACRQADCIIGARRMLESVAELGKPTFASYRPSEIRAYADAHPQYRNLVLVLSGDVGFYSGAKGLLAAFEDSGYELEVLPGISSVVCFCSRLHTSWEDVKLCSVHGRSSNLVAAIRENSRVFTLLSGSGSVRELCEMLGTYGLGHVRLTVGEQLGYPEERIVSGSPEELARQEFSSLCVALAENPDAYRGVLCGISDEEFLRGKAPMTKSEVRSVSVAKLRLTRDAVVYDVGAGTGSVTVEMALQASEGMVYAVEKQAEAADLIEENMRRFGTPNIQVIRGLAPEALQDLPAPTHVFIGGSSGNLKEILQLILEKNPQVRVVINAVTLETVGEMNQCLKELPFKEVEIVQLQAARAKALGSYQLMMGQNPVYIASARADKGEKTI